MQRVCPRIALGDDRRTAADVPHVDHHCLAADPPHRLPRSEQRRVCLTDSYLQCPLYRSSVGSPAEAIAGSSLLPDHVTTRLIVHDAPLRRRLRSSGRRARLASLALGATLALIGMALMSGAAGGLLARLEQAGGGAAPAVVAMTPTDQPTPPPRPTSGVAPSTPGPGPTLAPPRSSSPSPTPVPSPTSAPLVTYEVQPGDTLSTIAAAHGTSVEALVAANDLASADVILPGQRLVITHSGG